MLYSKQAHYDALALGTQPDKYLSLTFSAVYGQWPVLPQESLTLWQNIQLHGLCVRRLIQPGA